MLVSVEAQHFTLFHPQLSCVTSWYQVFSFLLLSLIPLLPDALFTFQVFSLWFLCCCHTELFL